MKGIKIKSIGAYAPLLTVTNDDLSKIVETSDEWITDRTGIKERRISEGEDTSEIASKAAKIALDRAGLSGEDIDLIIVGTVTPDNHCPSVSCIVQKEIGAENAMAFDITAACSGFVFGASIAYSMMQTNLTIKNALVIGAEVLSKIVDWEDRRTCVLFGDGGGAMILSREEMEIEKKFYFFNRSVGEKGDCLYAGADDVLNPYVKERQNKYKKLQMNGAEVFRFATAAIPCAIENVLSESKLTLEQIDYIVPHQANSRIISYTAKKLGLELDKFYLNLERYGNTSAASIPLALNEMYEKGMLKEGMKIIMVGFGGGLTYGAGLIEL